MSKFNQELFNNLIIDNWIIWFFDDPIKYKSWRLWHHYINWRNITEDVYLLDSLTDMILSFSKENWINPDCYYWVPEWGTKTAIITQFKWAKMQNNYWKWSHVLPMWRAKPKEHWMPKDKFFVWMPKWKTVIIEDTVTTWVSLFNTIDNLQFTWIDIEAVILLTDRNEVRDDRKTPWQIVKEKWIKYLAMSNLIDLFPIMKDKKMIKDNQWNETKKYFEKYWAVQI